jgi:hypothetical protein
MSPQQLIHRLMLSLILLTAILTSTEAHRSGCHRWHSCPSDHGTYTCGDLGYCSQCPDSAYWDLLEGSCAQTLLWEIRYRSS